MTSRKQRARLDQLPEVLDRLQQVITDGTWEPALIAIANVVGAVSADITMFDTPNRAVREWHCARVDIAAIQKYATEYVGADVRDAHPRLETVASLRTGDMASDSQVWNARERSRIPFFAEFYQPLMKSNDCLMSMAREATADVPAIVLSPHFRDSPSVESRRALAKLLPHVRRARETEERLRFLGRENDALLAALNRVNDAIVLLDESGRVAQGNVALWALVRSGGPIDWQRTADQLRRCTCDSIAGGQSG